MSSRLPTPSDFPTNLVLSIIPPIDLKHSPINVLIFLHGLGDTHLSFTSFARALSLPETVCISLQGLSPLPFDLGGFHWGDDIIFDNSSGEMEFDTGFSRSTKAINKEVIRKVLVDKCGYQSREIMLFGFGQGGMAALAAIAAYEEELSGGISIGGPIPSSISSRTTKNGTPILLLSGSNSQLIDREAIDKIKGTYKFVENVRWKKSQDSMPASREEMLPVMHFFSRRLRSRRGVPEGAVEIG
ncbi:MAG: hypothetical protein MMC33_007464 [Icmadophila ericetorum]|nr:hypothetical protein [Icmadophila ericetorum]